MLVTRIPEHVQNVMARLEAAGWEVWCVGGGVRDMRWAGTRETGT